MVSLHLYFILQFLVQLINLLDFGFICVTVILMNQRMYDVIVHFQLGFVYCLLSVLRTLYFRSSCASLPVVTIDKRQKDV